MKRLQSLLTEIFVHPGSTHCMFSIIIYLNLLYQFLQCPACAVSWLFEISMVVYVPLNT